MEKRELEVLSNYYYGLGKALTAWSDDIKKLDELNKIRKIYEIIDNDYDEIWYLIRDVKEKSYILKAKCGNSYAVDVMKEFKNKYQFFKISTDLIKMFSEGIYPIVFKIKQKNYSKYYDETNNVSNAFFSNYYCYTDNIYKSVRVYRNKAEFELFEKEDDAIYWCSNYNITKKQILSNNIRPFDLKEKVYNYEY